MTEDERNVLAWLDGGLAREYPHWAAVIKAMLARPVMPAPDDIPERVLFEMGDAANIDALKVGGMRKAARVLHAHLTAPRTKEVEVWRVEGAVRGANRWIPGCCVYATEEEARRRALQSEAGGWSCIRVTGPHKQTVPA